MTRNPLIAAAVAVLATLLVWQLVIAPRGAEMSSLESDIATAQSEVAALNSQLTSLRGIDAQALQVSLADYRKKLPPTVDEKGIIQVLLDASKRAGVAFDGLQFGTPSPSASGSISVITVSLSVKGAYFGLARFLFELEHLERLALVRGISINRGEDGLSMPLTVEMYTTDTSAGPGSDPAPGTEVGA